MSNRYTDIKLNTTVSLLVHGGNFLGFKLAKTLLEQGGKVIIVDHFNAQTKRFVTELKKIGNADFIDFSGLESLFKTISRIDYVYYILSEYLIHTPNFSSKDFLEESNYLNISLRTSQKNGAKISLITTIKLNEQLSAHILSSNLSAPAPYSAIELQKYCETLTAEYRDKTKLNARIIRLGTLLGTDVDLIDDAIISEMLEDSSNKGMITIFGEGLESHYLINIDDAVYGILKLTFATKTEGEVISLANNHEYTTLSLAYKLLEINSEISEIKFATGKAPTVLTYDHYVPAPNATNYGWEQNVTLEQTLLDTISTLYPKTGQIIKKVYEKPIKSDDEEIEVKRTSSVKTPLGAFIDKLFMPFTILFKSTSNGISKFRRDLTPRKIATLTSLGILSLLLLYFLILPLFTISLGTFLAYKNVAAAKDSLLAFDFEKSINKLEASKKYIDKTAGATSNLRWAFTLTNQDELYNNISQLVFASQYAVDGAKDSVTALEPLGNYLKNFKPALNFQTDLPSSSREYRDDLLHVQQNQALFKKGVYNISLATNLIESVKAEEFPEFAQKYIVEIKQYNDQLSDQIAPLEQVIIFLPDSLGLNKRMRYLFLFQNPSELRSTGGWLSSYAILAFEGGQIRELKVDDIYNLDGELINQDIDITAPLSMQKALELPNMTFSLSNWNPDLKSAATTFEHILSKVDPGTQIDGVITIDTEVLKKLLANWGEVIIPGETQPITAENLDSRINQLHNDFKPGQSLKAPFLANLANTSLQKILTTQATDFGDIGDVVMESLNEKHVTVYLKNKEAFQYLSDNGWSGIVDSRYLSLPFSVEWNWGANKVNSLIERSRNINVDITDSNNIDYQYTLAVKNKATSRVYPQGDYTNYLRIYMPEEAEIKEIKGFSNTDYQIYTEGGYKVLGGWFNVPIQTTKEFSIKYKLITDSDSQYKPISIEKDEFKYDLRTYKQAGTFEDPISISITYPDVWAVAGHTGMESVLNQLISQTKLKNEEEYNIIWNMK